MTNLFVTKGTITLANYLYTLGSTGNRTSITEHNGRQVHYAYDRLYRLTQERVTNAPAGPNGIVDYWMDAVGNRTNQTSTLTGIASTNFNFSANDWLTVDDYDASGNTTNSLKGADRYDVENRLIERVQGTNVITIVYNGDGQRVKKTVNGVSTWYLVDDRNHSGYVQVLEEVALDDDELTPSRIYSYGHDLISQKQVIEGFWMTHWYGYDGQGSTRNLIDENGDLKDSYDYDAYGNLILLTYAGEGATPNLYRYTGEQWDSDLGIYFLRTRYHNPETGRFWTLDSYEGTSRDPLTLHKYLYCHASPVGNIDPTGNSIVSFAVSFAISAYIRTMTSVAVIATSGWAQAMLFMTVIGYYEAYRSAGLGGVAFAMVPLGFGPAANALRRIDVGHIFHGHVRRLASGALKVVGFHHIGGMAHNGYARVVRVLSPRNAQGVYRAEVEVFDPLTRQWILKTNNNGVSTMFPDHWSRAQVLREIRGALDNATVNGSHWRGLSPSGVTIEGYFDSAGHVSTAYPIY